MRNDVPSIAKEAEQGNRDGSERCTATDEDKHGLPL
jgi:hypothetical protein